MIAEATTLHIALLVIPFYLLILATVCLALFLAWDYWRDRRRRGAFRG